MINHIKHSINLFIITSLLALLFVSCSSPNSISYDKDTIYKSADEEVEIIVRENQETGANQIIKSSFYGFSSNEVCPIQLGHIIDQENVMRDFAPYKIEYINPWNLKFSNDPDIYKIDRAEIWIDKQTGTAAIRYWTTHSKGTTPETTSYTTTQCIKLFNEEYFKYYDCTVNVEKLTKAPNDIKSPGTVTEDQNKVSGSYSINDNGKINLILGQNTDEYFIYDAPFQNLPKYLKKDAEDYNAKFFILSTNPNINKIDIKTNNDSFTVTNAAYTGILYSNGKFTLFGNGYRLNCIPDANKKS